MGSQGFEGCDIPCEPGWQLQAADADCAKEDGGPIRQCTGVESIGQVVQLEHLPCQALRFQQARRHLSLEGLDLCRHLHNPHTPWARGKELVSPLGKRAAEGVGPGRAAKS